MLITVVKSQIANLKVSTFGLASSFCVLSRELMDAANIVENEQLHILNTHTGEMKTLPVKGTDNLTGAFILPLVGFSVDSMECDGWVVTTYGMISAGSEHTPTDVIVGVRNNLSE